MNGPMTRWGNLALGATQVAAANLPAALGFGAAIPDRSHALDQPGVPGRRGVRDLGLDLPGDPGLCGLPGPAEAPRLGALGRLRGPAALMFAASTAWPTYIQGAGLGPPSVALGRVGRARWRPGGGLTGGEQAFVRWPIGLFAGWLTAATFVNLAATIKGEGGLRLGGLALSETDVALAALIATAALAASVNTPARGTIPSALPVAGALGWTARRNLEPDPDAAVVVVALGMLALLVLASLGATLGRPVGPEVVPTGGDMAAGRGLG